jgi:acetyl esterase/lipase
VVVVTHWYSVGIMVLIGALCLPTVSLAQEAAPEATPGDKESMIAGLAIPDGVTVVRDIAYREGDSEAWRLDLAMPDALGEEPRPALVFIHGGGWRSGDKRRAAFLGPTLEFAAKGYVCITVEYRLLQEATFPACVEDVKCAVRWLRAHAEEYNVDPERFGAYGNSAGAHLAAMLALCPPTAGLEGDGGWQEHSSMVQAAVCSATPASFLIPMNNRFSAAPDGEEDVAVQRRSRMPDEMRKKMSPITYVSAEAPPMLLFHDTADKTVFVGQADALVKALQDAGAKDVTYTKYENGSGHGVFGKNADETEPAREAFFERTLKKKQ